METPVVNMREGEDRYRCNNVDHFSIQQQSLKFPFLLDSSTGYELHDRQFSTKLRKFDGTGNRV